MTADEVPAFASLIPMARLLLIVAASGVLNREKKLETLRCDPRFRCRWCNSERTRLKLHRIVETGLEFVCRKRNGLIEYSYARPGEVS